MPLLQDITFALRALRRAPGFAAVATITIALGIGANTAIFSVVYGVIFKPLDFPESSRLVSIQDVRPRPHQDGFGSTPANFTDWRREARSFADLAAFASESMVLSGTGEAEQVAVVRTTPSLFGILATQPLLGRGLIDADSVRGTAVVVLSARLWHRRFGGDPFLIGRSISLDGVAYLVVGVMPKGFRYPLSRGDLWMPIDFGTDPETLRGAHYLDVIGRLKPGVTVPAAAAELTSIAGRLARAYPVTNGDLTVRVDPLRDRLVGTVRPALLLLLGAVGLVVVIACVNVANLLLARAHGRRNEIMVRIALGAGRRRLLVQLLIESVTLAALGGLASLALTGTAIGAVRRFGPTDIPRLGDIGLEPVVVLFAAALTVVTGVLFGLAPAFELARTQVGSAIRETDSRHARGHQMRTGLVLAELAIALMLVAGSGLLLKSFRGLVSIDPGFDPDHVLTFSLSLPELTYSDGVKTAGFYRELLGRIQQRPGVVAAGVVYGLPLTGFDFWSSFEVAGEPPSEPGRGPTTSIRLASPGFFAALRIPVRAGRGLALADRRDTPRVVVASQEALHRFWPDGGGLGRRLRFGASPGPDRLEGELVGVVGDVRTIGLDHGSPPTFYLSTDQIAVNQVSAVVRTTGAPERLGPDIRAIVKEMDPNLPVTNLATMASVVGASLAERRFYLMLLSVFAATALLLAAVGIYGVMAYLVTQRTREIGIRKALGADDRSVIGLVVRQSIGLTLGGIAIGVGASLLATPLLRSLLFGVEPTDPWVLTGVALLLAATGAVAGYLPARRAVRINPITAIRSA